MTFRCSFRQRVLVTCNFKVWCNSWWIACWYSAEQILCKNAFERIWRNQMQHVFKKDFNMLHIVTANILTLSQTHIEHPELTLRPSLKVKVVLSALFCQQNLCSQSWSLLHCGSGWFWCTAQLLPQICSLNLFLLQTHKFNQIQAIGYCCDILHTLYSEETFEWYLYACSSFDTPLRQEGQCPLLSLTEMYRDFELGDILPEKQSPDLFDISRYRIQCNQCRPEDSQQPRYPRLLFDSFFMYDLQQRLLLSAKKRLFWTGREFECKSCHFWHSTLEDCNIFFQNSFSCLDRRKGTNRLQLFETAFWHATRAHAHSLPQIYMQLHTSIHLPGYIHAKMSLLWRNENMHSRGAHAHISFQAQCPVIWQ